MARQMKPLVRGGGFYPSRKWTPLVYAGGYTTANGGEEPAPPPIEKTVTGNPIHITDALAKPAQALSIALEPIQDLHGYDNPWPAGGGKNKLYNGGAPTYTTGGITFVKNADGSVTANGTATADAQYSFEIDASLEGDLYFVALYGQSNDKIANAYLWDRTANARCKQWDGTTVSINSYNGTLCQARLISGNKYLMTLRVMNGKTVNNLTFYPMICASTETDSTHAPYSNICPISGWTEAKVTRTGINVWDEEWEVGGIDGTTGVNINNNSQIRSKNFIPIKPNTTYFGLALGQPSTSKFQTRFYDADKNYIGIGSPWNYNRSYITPSDAYYMRFCMQQSYGTIYNNDISINYPATDTSYHAYQGDTYSITFPSSAGTVYGGTLDVTTGKLTVDRKFITLLPTMSWQYSAGTQRFFVAVSGAASGSGDIPFHGSCNVFKAGTGTEDNAVSYVNTSFYGFAIKYPAANGDMTAWKQFLSDNTVSVVYELATPTTIQLTPQQVELLQGENNLWSDGTMTLVYLADGNASDAEALNILLGGRYVNNHGEDEPTDREALDILLGGNTR